MSENAYVGALIHTHKGETRTFGEIAALAGKPSGARAAGRALSSYPADGKAAWQRAVTADGGLSIDPERALVQLERLRKEGARPKDGESVAKWAKRVGAEIVGNWRRRCFARRVDPRIESFDPRFVERFESGQHALDRGFRSIDGACDDGVWGTVTPPPKERKRRAAKAQ